MPQRSSRRLSFGPIALLTFLVLTIASVIFWIWPSPSVRLDTDGYAIATALYRVCNQQDVDGLRQIEEKIRQSGDSRPYPSAQQSAILEIIRHAQSGNWGVAMRQCRILLEDQVSKVSRVEDADVIVNFG